MNHLRVPLRPKPLGEASAKAGSFKDGHAGESYGKNAKVVVYFEPLVSLGPPFPRMPKNIQLPINARNIDVPAL